MKTQYDNVFINPTRAEVEKNVIAFDLDSVLNTVGHDIGHWIARWFGVTFDSIRSVNPEHGYEKFHFSVPGASQNEMVRAIEKFIIVESPSSLPSPFMLNVIRYVYELTGTPIAVVTSRTPETAEVTRNWLHENLDGIPFRAYIQHGVPKHDTLYDMDAQIFIDDKWKTIQDLCSWIDFPVLYQQPWNQGRPKDLGVIQIRDLRDIIPVLNIRFGRVPMEWPWYIPFPKPEGERMTKKYATIV